MSALLHDIFTLKAFTLHWPWFLLLLPLPALVRWLSHAAEQREQAALFFPSLDALLTARGDGNPALKKSEPAPLWLWLVWFLLLLACARPQWHGEPVGIPTSGRDLLLVVDISGSMETPDMKINDDEAQRIDVVKKVVGEFVAKRSGDRVGLVLFGSQAYLQTPLTFDRNTLVQQLNEAQLGFAGERTAIGDGIALSAKRLQDREQKSRVMILLTDGANTAGTLSPLQGADLATSMGIKIYTIGMGADLMERQTFFGTQRFNPSADLDEKTLSTIADKTGGSYFRARSTEELQGIYQLLDQLEPAAGDEEKLRPIIEWFYWPLAAALLISFGAALFSILRERQNIKSMQP
jgi:Ca-activated chloride channel family protein